MVNWVRIYLLRVILLFGVSVFPAFSLAETTLNQAKGDYASGATYKNFGLPKFKMEENAAFTGRPLVDDIHKLEGLKGNETMEADSLSQNLSAKYLKDSIVFGADSFSNFQDTLLLTPADFFISFEKDSLKKAWKNYLAWRNRYRDSSSPESDFISEDSLNEMQLTEYFSREEAVSDLPLKNEENKGLDSISPDPVKLTQEIPEINKTEKVSGDRYSRFPFYFVVQVAASREELDSTDLKQEYQGPFEVRKIKEDGWYKYQVGTTENYLEALQILKSIPSGDCFLVAYNADNDKLKLWKAVLIQKQNMIRYRVQIAASTIPLNDEEILDIYDGEMKIQIVEEEGWYKYQIDVGQDYRKARENEKVINVDGAFMVPYLGNEKMPLYKVLKFYRF